MITSSTVISSLATVMMTLNMLIIVVGFLLYFRSVSQWITAPVLRKQSSVMSVGGGKTRTTFPTTPSTTPSAEETEENDEQTLPTPHPQIHFALGICMWSAINGAWNLTDDSDEQGWQWLTVASLATNTIAWLWLLKAGILSEWMQRLNASKWMYSILGVPVLVNITMIWFRLVDILPHGDSRNTKIADKLSGFTEKVQASVLGSIAKLSPKDMKTFTSSSENKIIEDNDKAAKIALKNMNIAAPSNDVSADHKHKHIKPVKHMKPAHAPVKPAHAPVKPAPVPPVPLVPHAIQIHHHAIASQSNNHLNHLSPSHLS